MTPVRMPHPVAAALLALGCCVSPCQARIPPHGRPEAVLPLPPMPAPAAPSVVVRRVGSVTGLALPRFASLRANLVNMRVGPGLRYPILWVYKRRHLPVEIWREFGAWRYVQDYEGVKGWMHQATLTRRRGFIVVGAQQVLREAPNPHAEAVARLNPGVVGWLRRCAAGAAWCEVEAGGYRGWLPRIAFWGALPHEAIED